jgi:hypothetical protein
LREKFVENVIEGRMVGKKPRGRPRMGVIDDLNEGSYSEMKKKTADKEKWRSRMPRTCWKAAN